MCGRYKRKSDKQKIAEAFRITGGLGVTDFDPEDDIAPGSMQPVVSLDENGERRLELMRWGFKLPDRLLFNARSEGIDTAKFWKDAFSTGRVIVPADSIFEWKEMPKGQKSQGTNSRCRGKSHLEWLVSRSSGRTQRRISGSGPLP